jgi:hypothetical protein
VGLKKKKGGKWYAPNPFSDNPYNLEWNCERYCIAKTCICIICVICKPLTAIIQK